ncbi:hypothetical protein OSB04_005111 [Centaurea solstitialis]|uniref:Uncharacterized protein n=1 Tax=Centaurea solstitialis TaxID=347529 RepID=A0AA38TT88_9ASTR|nr:hypothetical protein OSB04_005111 [Centaurea solstitialis]
MEVASKPMDFNFNYSSSCYTTSAPSSPGRLTELYCGFDELLLAAAGAHRTTSLAAVPFAWEEKPGVPKGPTNLFGEDDFSFDVGFELSRDNSVPAEDLFQGGLIKPLGCQVEKKVERERESGRERGRERFCSSALPSSRSRRTRSMSPLGGSDQRREQHLTATASDGRAMDRDPLKKYSAIFRKHDQDIRNSSGSGSVSKRRGRVSAHELHYNVNRAISNDMKKKTYLPYKQDLQNGWLGLKEKTVVNIRGPKPQSQNRRLVGSSRLCLVYILGNIQQKLKIRPSDTKSGHKMCTRGFEPGSTLFGSNGASSLLPKSKLLSLITTKLPSLIHSLNLPFNSSTTSTTMDIAAAMDFNFNSSPYNHYNSAPSSPTRLTDFYCQFDELFISAEAATTRTACRAAVPFAWEEKPGVPKGLNDSSEDDFSFDVSSQFGVAPAEDLFQGGVIKIGDPTTKDKRGVERERGRERGFSNSSSRSRRTRSMSPLGGSDYRQQQRQQQQIVTVNNVKPPTASTSSNSSESGSRKWSFKDLFLFRSASDGRAMDRDPLKKYSNVFRKNDQDFRNSPESGSVSKRKGRVSAHELHYNSNRAVSNDMKRKTYLPYRNGILGGLTKCGLYDN